MELKNSTANSPDLDWSQVRETVRMMNLAVAQIEMALRQSDDSIGALTNSFTSMVGYVNAISQTAAKMTCDENADDIQNIQADCRKVVTDMQHSIVAFQFYDKLTQRLDHVNHALNSLGDLVADQERLYNPNEWVSLQQAIRSRYSMKEEQDMFDTLLQGATIDEALEQCREKINEITHSESDIELF
ncbi:MAG: hypothetical protein PVG66_12310 [Chromatiales bacterium]|jgi:hypothetical protein